MINKNDFWEYLFGDFVRNMMYKYKISPMIFVSLAITFLIYKLYIKKHKKEAKYNIKEKLYIGIMIYVWILTLIHQVFVIIYF